MQDLYQSIVKTEHSYIDNISIKDQRDSNDVTEKIEQFKHILKWVYKRGPAVCGDVEGQKRNASEYSYFVVKIQSISNLVFKKISQSSKVYAILNARLVNIKTNKQYLKQSRIVKVLQETNTYLYQMKQPICFYFYTRCQTELILKIQVLLIQQDTKHEKGIPLFGSPQNAGSLQIDFLKEHKGRQKKNLILPNEFVFFSREIIESSSNSNAISNFVVVKSEAYKYLEKIIAEHTLCDSTDKIAGIMGYFLPISQNTLTDFALTPEAQGLQLSFASIQINSQLIKQVYTRAENMVKAKWCQISKVSTSIGDMVLHAKFHNGWKVVSTGATIIKQKGDLHLKTNNSNLSDLQAIQTNRKNAGKIITQGQLKTKLQYKRYLAQSPIELSLIFPQQEQCVLIYQLVADVTVRGQMPNAQKKDNVDHFQEVIEIPLCFGISSAKSIGNYRSTTCTLNPGGCLNSFQNLKDAIQHNLKQISQFKKIQVSKTVQQSKNRIPSIVADFDSISDNNKTLKTIENISHFTFKNLRSEVGSLDFEMQLIEKQENMQQNMNLSLPMENFSSLNISKLDVRDKIQNQKQRIAKQSKKNLPITKPTNRLDISFIKQVIISEHQKNQLLSKINIQKENSYYAKEAFLKFLKQQVNKNYHKPINPHFQLPKKLKQDRIKRSQMKKLQFQYLKMLYSINISKLQPQVIAQHKYSRYYYYLYSNYIINQKYYFKYEETPLQIIKTELSEINYNNCYFINFIQISNHINHQVIKFPKAFYFKFKFYNQDEVRSELMTINKDTGEILLSNGGSGIEKILHIEVDIDEQPNNFLLKFIQFIQYLHNGVLNIDIIDYFTGLLFGTFTIPLRNLIRKRRNEVIYVHEDWIYHRNLIRSNMKVQMRAIRKMRNRMKIQNKSPEKEKNHSPLKDPKLEQTKIDAQRDQRLNRIQRFKQKKNKCQIKIPQSQLKSQITHVAKIINKAYVNHKTKIMVTYLKKQFFFIEINNKHDESCTFTMTINDEDKRWIQRNSLSGQQQVTIVRDPSRLQKDDYQILTSSKKNQQRMMKCFKVNQEQLIEMGARAKGFLLLCYLTVRRYRSWDQAPKEQELIIYNRERTINCSLINERDGSIQSINAIDIIPAPQEASIELQYYRPAEQQSLIHIPFIDPQYLSAKIDQMLIDDPYIIVLPGVNNELPLIKRFASQSNGIYLKISNDIALQACKEYNVLLLFDVKKKQMLLGESRKNDRRQSRFKTQSRMVVESIDDVSGPKMVNLKLRVWGCLKFTIQVPLWGQLEGSISLPNHIFNKDNVKYFILANDDQDSLKLFQDNKNKHQNLQMLRVNQIEGKTQILYTAFSNTPNQSYVSVHAIDGNQIITQEQSIKNKEFSYVYPFYRIVVLIKSFIPNFKEMLKINVNRASQGVLEEPFVYHSSCNKKTEFKIHSSDASLVWVKNNDAVFQIEAKGDRKIHISFHTQKIIERSALTGSCEGVVLGVKWDKGIDYYGFKFNIF